MPTIWRKLVMRFLIGNSGKKTFADLGFHESRLSYGITGQASLSIIFGYWPTGSGKPPTVSP